MRTDRRNGTSELRTVRTSPALRIVVYAAVIFVLAVFETGFSTRFAILGAVPSYLLALTASAAFFEGENTGIVVGIASGFVADALGASGISIRPLAFMAIGFAVGYLSARLGHDRDLHVGILMGRYSIWLAAAVGMGIFADLITLLLGAGSFNIFSALWNLILPHALVTFILGWPICLIYLLILKKKLSNGK